MWMAMWAGFHHEGDLVQSGSKSDYLQDLAWLTDIAPVAYSNHGHDDIIQGLKATLTTELSSRAQADSILAHHITEDAIRQFLLSSLASSNNASM